MMEITEIRRSNVRSLMSAFVNRGGSKKDFATMIGIESPQLIHITAEPPSRNIGDRIARRLEVNLKLPRGWLDVKQNVEKYNPNIADTGAFIYSQIQTIPGLTDPTSPGDFALVELNRNDISEDVNVESGPDAIKSIVLSDAHANRLFGARSASNLRIFTQHGDAMKGTIEPGEVVVLDNSRAEFTSDGIYLFTFAGGLHLKRLQRVKDEIRVISDNSIYDRWTIAQDEIEQMEIIGLLVGKWKMEYSRLG